MPNHESLHPHPTRPDNRDDTDVYPIYHTSLAIGLVGVYMNDYLCTGP